MGKDIFPCCGGAQWCHHGFRRHGRVRADVLHPQTLLPGVTDARVELYAGSLAAGEETSRRRGLEPEVEPVRCRVRLTIQFDREVVEPRRAVARHQGSEVDV